MTKLSKKVINNVAPITLDSCVYLEGKNKTLAQCTGIELIDNLKNLFDFNNVTNGMINSSNGTISSGSLKVSNFIRVHENQIYTHNRRNEIFCYDINKSYIGQLNAYDTTTVNKKFLIPSGCFYIRTQDHGGNDTIFVIGDKLPRRHKKNTNDYFAFKNEELRKDAQDELGIYSDLRGMIWACHGDSITNGTGAPCYFTMICDEYGITGNNYAVGGATISNTGNPNLRIISEDYVNMRDDADIITICAGFNDRNQAIGTVDDTTNETFCGALNVLCKGLIAKYPAKPILFFTPVPAKEFDLSGHADAIINVCGKYSIPVFDLHRRSSLYPKDAHINSTYYRNGDGVHPNDKGHKVFYKRLADFMISHI